MIAGEPPAPLMGLLLPAVQKVREAAARMGPAVSPAGNFDIVIRPLDTSDNDPVPGPFAFDPRGIPLFEMRAQNQNIPGAAARVSRSLIVTPAAASNSGLAFPVWEIPLAAGVAPRSFFPYEPSFRGGVRVAAGDINGDGVDDIVTGAAGPGGSPHVKVFDGVSHAQIAGFLAFDPAFTGGVNVAAGDVNGDGTPDVIVSARGGGGPVVKVFNGNNVLETGPGSPSAPPPLLPALFTQALPDSFPTMGVHVAAGDLDGDGRAEVIANPYSTPKPGASQFHPIFLRSIFSANGAITGLEPVDGFSNPFGPDYRGGIVALPEELDGATRGQELVFTAFSGFIPEPSATLPVLGVAAALLVRRRHR